MASYKIRSTSVPYYDVEVSFGDQSFRQTIIVPEGADVEAAVQSYADQYESDWNAAQVPPPEL